MPGSIWRDRVWLALLAGPFVWAGLVILFREGSQEGVQLFAAYAQGMCLSVAAVSVLHPLLGAKTARDSH
jgi:hypothetical protein